MECPDCFSRRIQENNSSGEFVCTDCGLVTASCTLETNPHPPTYCRVVTQPIKGYNRMVKTLESMCQDLEFKSISVISQNILANALSSPTFKLRKGDYASGYLVAIIFHACALSGMPRTPKELCARFGCSLPAMRKMVKDVQHAADMVRLTRSYSYDSPNPLCVIHRPLQALGLAHSTQRRIKEFSKQALNDNMQTLSTLSTDSVVAALIFVATGRQRENLQQISRVCNVCRNTITTISSRIPNSGSIELPRDTGCNKT